jgi:hypothetical protein
MSVEIARLEVRCWGSERGPPTPMEAGRVSNVWVSTTPIWRRAVFYATRGFTWPAGYVYKIDRARLCENGVAEYIVSEYTNTPSVPEDEEVILGVIRSWNHPRRITPSSNVVAPIPEMDVP